MKKIVVVSDSFKGTLSSMEICRLARRTVPRVFPGCAVDTVPVADGGCGCAAALGVKFYNEAGEAYDLGVTAMFPINREAVSLEASAPRSRENYARALEDVLRLFRAAERRDPASR